MKKDNYVSIYRRNLPLLTTEMFNVGNNMAPELLHNIFKQIIMPYKPRNQKSFKKRHQCGELAKIGVGKIFWYQPSSTGNTAAKFN